MARKILIVDDQEDIILILEREFRRVAGITVMTATKYADAIATIVAKPVDLVISDVRLKSDSGFDLVRYLNQHHPNVGAILMSAYRSPANHQQAKDLGVHLFLEKPFQIPKLIQEVENYFQQKENPTPVAATAETGTSTLEEHFKLQDLVQLFCLNGRNILITVASGPNQMTGEIYIQRGSVIHAEFNGKTGDAGFHSLMRLPEPILKVKDWTAPVPVTIQSSWVHLLLESAVHVDHESQRQASGLG